MKDEVVEVLPHFISRGEGQVINVSSMLGRIPRAIIRSAYNGAHDRIVAYYDTIGVDP